jgi:hypothetical protein
MKFNEMKFKVGDKIKHKEFGIGEIVHINEEIICPYAVQFETFNKNLHDLGKFGAPKVKNGHGFWCEECDLELDKQQPQNLIPQIAKMLGVEIGEEFKISNRRDVYKFTEDGLIGMNSFRTYIDFIAFFKLIIGKEKIIKLPQKPILTEDEKTILRNLPRKYKWIARDSSGALFVYGNKPEKGSNVWTGDCLGYFNSFKHLFQFIKWEDKEPYNIEELLKGE